MTSTPIAIIGPTATGKSDMALMLAREYHGEVVNIDAMQQYRGMDIGTAKLPAIERAGIVHHQLDVLDIDEVATVARYQQAARADIDAIHARGHRAIIVGGSMLYIQSLLDDWRFPETDPVVRARYEQQLDEVGVAAMHQLLAQRDPQAAASILPSDPRRVVRALEVGELTGKPFAASAPTIGEPRWGTRIIALDRDTAALDERIQRRTDLMFESGFVDEVHHLLNMGLRDGQTARRAIGYSHVIDALDADGDIDAARTATCIATRRYVRRQRSWFRRDKRIRWFDASSASIADDVRKYLDSSELS